MKKQKINFETKLEVIRRYDNFESPSKISRDMNLRYYSVKSIIRRRNQFRIPSVCCYNGSKSYRIRKPIMHNMEMELQDRIMEMNRKGHGINRRIIMRYSKRKMDHLISQNPGFALPRTQFKASRNWYRSFLRRYSLTRARLCGEKANADCHAAMVFSTNLVTFITNRYSDDLIFNIDETNFCYKQLSKSTIRLIGEEASSSKFANSRSTLLLGTNASGSLKLKPLMMVSGNKLPDAATISLGNQIGVHMAETESGFMRADFLKYYIEHQFLEEVAAFCSSHNYEFNVLLLIDSAPSHSKRALGNIDPRITIKWIPKNTTCLIQPMDQGVIYMFKENYQMLMEMDLIPVDASLAVQSVKDFWAHRTWIDMFQNMADAWGEISSDSVRKCWNNLLHGLSKVPYILAALWYLTFQ